MRIRPAARALALASLGLGPGCAGDGGGEPERALAERIVLVTLDTVRADHLGCYGYGRDTSPALDAFARTATRYTRARAAAPWTLPSHASLFTGLYPLEHGARTYDLKELPAVERFNQAAALEAGQISPLAAAHRTLAEALREVGYRTGAVAANAAYLSRKMGLDQGFAHYDVAQGRAQAVNERVLRWLDRVQDGPFFLFVNYMDAHLPFNAEPRPELFPEPVPRDSMQRFEALYLAVIRDAGAVDPRELATLVDQYDLGIRNLDAGLGELFDALRERGLWEDALVVVTSDHGEFLGEKDLLGHNKDVYQGTLDVPLLVKLPGQTAARVDDAPISHVHLPHLILEHARRGRRAAALLPPPRPRESLLAENYYSRLRDLEPPWGARFDRVRRALYLGDLKFIHSSDGAHELYDLAADPDETENLLDAGEGLEDWERRLAALLADLLPPGEHAGGLELDEEDLANLRDLGYLGNE